MKFLLLIPILALGMPSSCSKKTATPPPAQTSKAIDFPTVIANPGTINIVDFSATWCPPCKQLKPILASIAAENPDTVRLTIIDVDAEKDLAAQNGVSGIPDVRFYVNGKEVEKFTGGVPKEHIDQIIAGLLEKHAAELKQPVSTNAPAGAPTQPQAINPATPTNPGAPPAVPASPTTPVAPTAPNPTIQPTIQPSKGNDLPPGMSKG